RSTPRITASATARNTTVISLPDLITLTSILSGSMPARAAPLRRAAPIRSQYKRSTVDHEERSAGRHGSREDAMSEPHARGAGALRRELGLLDAVGIGFGAIIGAGIFVVTGVAAGVAGPAFLVGLLIAGLAATMNALTSAQLAAAYSRSGG